MRLLGRWRLSARQVAALAVTLVVVAALAALAQGQRTPPQARATLRVQISITPPGSAAESQVVDARHGEVLLANTIAAPGYFAAGDRAATIARAAAAQFPASQRASLSAAAVGAALSARAVDGRVELVAAWPTAAGAQALANAALAYLEAAYTTWPQPPGATVAWLR